MNSVVLVGFWKGNCVGGIGLNRFKGGHNFWFVSKLCAGGVNCCSLYWLYCVDKFNDVVWLFGVFVFICDWGMLMLEYDWNEGWVVGIDTLNFLSFFISVIVLFFVIVLRIILSFLLLIILESLFFFWSLNVCLFWLVIFGSWLIESSSLSVSFFSSFSSFSLSLSTIAPNNDKSDSLLNKVKYYEFVI
jgi:hypothetical protein